MRRIRLRKRHGTIRKADLAIHSSRVIMLYEFTPRRQIRPHVLGALRLLLT